MSVHICETATKIYIWFLLVKLPKSSATSFPIATAISIPLKILKLTLYQRLPVMNRWAPPERLYEVNIFWACLTHQPCHDAQQPQRLSPRNTSSCWGSTTANFLPCIVLVDKALVCEVGDAGSLPVCSWDLSHISQDCIHHQLKVKLRLKDCLSCLLKPYFRIGEDNLQP